MLSDPVFDALLKVGIAGAIAGMAGSFAGSVRANVVASLLLGAIGGLSSAAVLRVLNVDPIISAGRGFSYLWAAVGGAFLGYVVSRSSR